MEHVNLIRDAVESHSALTWSDKDCSGGSSFRCYLKGHVGPDKHFLRVNKVATCTDGNNFANRCCYFICGRKKLVRRFGSHLGEALASKVLEHFGPLCKAFGDDGLMLRTTAGLHDAIIRFGDDITRLLEASPSDE